MEGERRVGFFLLDFLCGEETAGEWAPISIVSLKTSTASSTATGATTSRRGIKSFDSICGCDCDADHADAVLKNVARTKLRPYAACVSRVHIGNCKRYLYALLVA